MYITMEDSTTYYVHTEGTGHPLLLLHGFTGSSDNWNPFFDEWKKVFKIISIDLIGHGNTDSPESFDRYTMDKVIKDIIVILEKLNIHKTFALGYSMGGRVALSLACSHPDRIEKLVLESSSPGLKTPQERMERVEKDEALAHFIEENGVEAFALKWEDIPLFQSQKLLPEEKKVTIRTQRLRNSYIGLANSLRGMGTGSQPSLWDLLPKLKTPTLLLCGEYDEKFITIAKEMDSILPFSKKIEVIGAGHAIHVERPDFFGKIVMDWFSST